MPVVLQFVLVAQLLVPADEPRFPFSPAQDDFRADAKLDLRWLNEKTAGESGFVRVDDKGDFVLGNGKPLRFWAVNSTVGREKPYVIKPQGRKTEPDLDRHARFLAKRGVNAVRLHAHLNPDLKAAPNAAMTDVDEKEADWILRSVAAYKKEGIYTVISPYWANSMTFSNAWELDGGIDQQAHGLLFFEEKMQEAYKAWWRKLLAAPNPYTGIPLAKDPAIAILQLQNEDSLLFYTVDRLKGPMRDKLARRFYDWAVKKHGSIEAVRTAWGWPNNEVKTDDLGRGILDFAIIWWGTQNLKGGFAQRFADQLEFFTGVMMDFNREMTRFFREDLGSKHLVNATNWKTADPVRMEDIERYSYTSTDVAAVNRYYSGVHNGPNRTWAIINNDEFTSPSILKDPRQFPLNIRQVKGLPFLVTESAWVMPMAFATEGPFLVAAYQSLTGIDAFFWFTTGDDEWSPPQSANGYLRSQQKWMFGNPDMLGMFPAAAVMHRMGYVRKGEPALLEERSLKDMWARRTPLVGESASWDPNRDAGDIAPESGVKTALSHLVFLAGPVEFVPGGEPARTRTAALDSLIDPGGQWVISTTGEVAMHIGESWCMIDAPKAQGIAAFFDKRSLFTMADVTLWSGNQYGTALVVALDDKPIRESFRLLVQVGTRSRPAEWKESPKPIKLTSGEVVEGFSVDNFGRAPWEIVQPDFHFEIRNPALVRATVLDANGNAREEIPLQRYESSVWFAFPKDALYVVLE